MVAIAATNGCTGTPPSLPVASTNVPAARPDVAENLLYVIVKGFADVEFYSYFPAPLKYVNKLTGIKNPYGLCANTNGDVFVTAEDAIVEYPHGGTKRVATLKVPSMHFYGCAVDPTTGNLAAAALQNSGNYEGAVLVFQDARGTPKKYFDPHLQYPAFVTYDDSGNLFMDGTYYYSRSSSCCVVSAYAELSPHESAFRRLHLNKELSAPTSIQWAGNELAIEDAASGIIHEFKLSGHNGTQASETVLKGMPPSISPAQAIWIQGHDVLGADPYYAEVGIWHYPAGGSPFRAITGLYEPTAVVVSLKNKQAR